MARKYIQGKFKPRNPYKYKGNLNEIYYRSSWEAKLLTWLDGREDIIQYSSEEIIIPYKSPIDGRWHMYYPDNWIKFKDSNGNVREAIIEVKPYAQTIEPIKQTKITKSYVEKVQTYAINKAKWEYAKRFCEEKNWEFHIFTEKDLNF